MNNNQIPDKEICGPNAIFSKVFLLLNKYQVIPDSEETNKILRVNSHLNNFNIAFILDNMNLQNFF